MLPLKYQYYFYEFHFKISTYEKNNNRFINASAFRNNDIM